MIGQQQEQDGQITAVAKLIDQGLVYDLKQPSEDKNNLCGTPSFIAPEMLNGSVKTNGISPAADVFAMGVMLMEVLLPELNDVVDNFDKETCKTLGMVGQFDVEKNINRENFVTSLPDILTLRQQKLADDKKMPYSDDQLLFLGNLLKDCLAQKPEDRPSAAQVGELIQIFSASIGDPTNLMSYKDAKNLAEEDRPKAIPFAIRNMIADPNNHNAGFIALKELVKADKSYKTTLSYGLAMLYEDKYSKRGKFKKIFNKTTSFKQWAKENPSVASTLRARVYVKPNNPSEKQNIPVSQDFYDIIHSKQI